MTNYNNSAVYTNRKSKKNNVSEVRAAIYCRLSKDDNLDGESESIQNQKLLLTDYCRGHGWNIAGVYEDDGISGLK
ncbi:MAG: recombinase family protein, partial [Clostridia bacterium]|nr:recombinase family protein [Clostridia bacterium]